MTIQRSTQKNKLASEKSPYLLQHADNPVQWYPWGEEAFRKALAENLPVFLSIGYSTCHWCHVMAHESFEDPQIAAFLNEHFISIKVDREERPDLDGIYMSAVMAMTGRGGWPMSVFLTPEQKPFFGGTYFPPQAKWGSPGFLDVLRSIENAWKNNHDQLVASSDQLTKLIQEGSIAQLQSSGLSPEIQRQAYERFLNSYDKRHAGFGAAPKFPTSHNLNFLMRYWHNTGETKSLEMVLATLRAMAEGGLYDHLGGGFHRYSTDELWQIPHFEKMLYDQATLTRSYLEAYQITHEDYYANVARDIIAYVLRDLKDKNGGFYSAEDADSLEPGSGISAHKKEGAFYVWPYQEIKSTLNKDQWEVFFQRYGIKEDGNAHSDPHEEFIGKNILFALQTPQDVAAKTGRSQEEVERLLREARHELFTKRAGRPRPHLDDKIIVDWNALMISSLAFAARVLNDKECLSAAEGAAQFVIKKMIDKKGRLFHRYRDQDVAILGSLEDYAFFIDALIELYQASYKDQYLSLALELSESMIRLFWDEEKGGFFFTASDAPKLLIRQKEVYDGAIPSGNSMAALDMIRLYHLTFDRKWEDCFERSLQYFSSPLNAYPQAHTQLLMAYQFDLGPSQEIVISSPKKDALVEKYAQQIAGRFLPYAVNLLRVTKEDGALLKMAPFLKAQEPIDHIATVYLCEDHVCQLPVNDVQHFSEQLKKIARIP